MSKKNDKHRTKNFDKNLNASDAFAALLTASLLLPGLAQSSDDSYRSEKTKLSYHKAKYSESNQRMDIDVDHITIQAPLLDKYTVQFDAIKDVTSGASPVLNLLNSNNEPQQTLITSASIKDQRDVFELGVTSYGDKSTSGVKVGHSKEDDYRSRYISADISVPFNNKNTTINAGFAYAKDDVWNTYEADVLLNTPTKYRKRKKLDLLVGVEQILNKNSFVGLSLKTSHSSGYLSDPYKKVQASNEGFVTFPVDALDVFFESDFAQNNFLGQLVNQALVDNELTDLDSIFLFINETGLAQTFNDFVEQSDLIDFDTVFNSAGIFFDKRPTNRSQTALGVSYSRYLEKFESGLHLDYRFSKDSWGADSHTLEAKLKKQFGKGWMIATGLRYYTQDNAEFYNIVFTDYPQNNVASSDYRLASFASLAPKFEISKQINEHINVQLNYEYYERRYDLALDKGIGSDIDDYTYDMLALNFQYEF